MEKVIDITAKRDGFRRCGIAHSEKTTTYPLGRFTAKELEQLQNEPQLVVAIRNKDETSTSLHFQQSRIIELEAVVETLSADLTAEHTKSAGLQSQLDVLTSELDGEQRKVAQLLADMDAERNTVIGLTTELDAERQKVAELTEQLQKLADKKGK
ncbi:HI1506-related protein [Enterobacter mori]|uniref:HI1506-related protein n=1 Tax=Enterobacter mori TaxID=539813 RepID=UPI003B840549